MRPMFVFLAAKMFGKAEDSTYVAASLIELLHTATLVHDDVVDESEMRRGEQTASSIWGNEAAVLVGDYLYSRAFQLMVLAKSMQVMTLMADTTNTIAQGEVLQLLNINDPDTTEQNYHQSRYPIYVESEPRPQFVDTGN